MAESLPIDHPKLYHSFLLRMWRESLDSPWRATLRCTRTTQEYTFAPMPELLAFLDDVAEPPTEAGPQTESVDAS